MANIYDIATIQARDPLGLQTEAHAEATAKLAKYRHKKEIIAEINNAIKKAEKEAKKSGGFLESLIPTLAGGLVTGMTGIPMPHLMGVLASGATSYGLEKHRQDKAGATKELEKLEKKYKGRGYGDAVKSARETIDEALDSQLLMGTLADAGMQAIFPAKIGIGKNIRASVPLGKGAPTKNIPGLFPEIGFKPDWAKAGLKNIFGVSEDLVNQLFKFGAGLGKNTLLANLLKGGARTLGPSALEDLFRVEPDIDPLSDPQFRNPYRGGY